MVRTCLVAFTPRGLLTKNVPPERFLNARILIKSQVLYQLS